MGKLAKTKIKKLESLPGWTWDALETQWQEAYEALLVEVEVKGTVSFPQDYVGSSGH